MEGTRKGRVAGGDRGRGKKNDGGKENKVMVEGKGGIIRVMRE